MSVKKRIQQNGAPNSLFGATDLSGSSSSLPLQLCLMCVFLALLLGCAHGKIGEPKGFIDAVPPGWMPEWREAAPGVSYLSREASENHPAVHLLRVDLQNARTAVEVPEPVPEGLELSRLRGGVPLEADITFQPELNNFPSSDSGLMVRKGYRADPSAVWAVVVLE